MRNKTEKAFLISIIIPAYGRCSLLTRMIGQLLDEIIDNQNKAYELQINIVDNGTIEDLSEFKNHPAISILNPKRNTYYFGAAKYVLETAKGGDILVILNQDIQLSSKSFVGDLVQTLLESPPRTAAVCPIVALLDLPTRVNCFGLSNIGNNLWIPHFFMHKLENLENNKIIELEGLSGCAFAIHTCILNEFFQSFETDKMFYNEDVALTNYLLKKEYRILGTFDCLILHDYKPGILSFKKICHWVRSRRYITKSSKELVNKNMRIAILLKKFKLTIAVIISVFRFIYQALSYKIFRTSKCLKVKITQNFRNF